MSRSFVVGATGAVGSELVQLLKQNEKFSNIVVLARRKIENEDCEKISQKIVDFENIKDHSEDIQGSEIAFCALGTTRAKSGADGFYKVDHDFVVNTAKLAKENGVKHFILVSSGGADANSTFLYMKTKGEVENEIEKLAFEKFAVMRPGLIEAKREEFRFAESLSGLLLKPLKLFSNRFSCSAKQIAQAMILASTCEESGKFIWDNSKIIEKSKNYEN